MRIIITGAASGIGRAVASALLARDMAGEHRLLLVDRDADGLKAMTGEMGAAVETLAADVGAPDCGERIVGAAVARLGGIDGIVSNAGMLMTGSLATLETAMFDQVFAVNTRATWLIAKAAYPVMRDAGGGSIVATASMSAWDPAPPLGAYAPSKAALVMIMRQLANEWGPDGIRCNTVSPGPTLTGMNAGIFADPARRDARAANIPTRRMGEPADVANAILFLLGDGARQINGIDILVDGGLSTTMMTAGLQVAQ